jgi:hypothetical protein
MPVEFAYAQARAQARHGARLSQDAWRALESDTGLAQYLHAIRSTALAPRVRHFTAATPAHAIERSLRRDWRSEVDNAAHWVPRPWRESVTWTTWWPDLPAIAHLRSGGEVLAWMQDDPVLSAFVLPDPEARRQAIEATPLGEPGNEDLVENWLERWRALWPRVAADDASLAELVDLLRRHRHAQEDDALDAKSARDLADDFERRVIRLLRTRVRQPVIVCCHLILSARELWRLRSGLIRRALFNDVPMEGAA